MLNIGVYWADATNKNMYIINKNATIIFCTRGCPAPAIARAASVLAELI